MVMIIVMMVTIFMIMVLIADADNNHNNNNNDDKNEDMCGCGGLVNMSPSRKSISGHLHICHEIVQDVKLCVSTNKCLLQPIVYLSPKDFPIGNG